MIGLQKRAEEKEILALVFFLCSVFAPLWGVGNVLPFLLVLTFVLLKNFLHKEAMRYSGKKIKPSIIVFILFSGFLLFSSLITLIQNGSTEGFWVVFPVPFLFRCCRRRGTSTKNLSFISSSIFTWVLPSLFSLR